VKTCTNCALIFINFFIVGSVGCLLASVLSYRRFYLSGTLLLGFGLFHIGVPAVGDLAIGLFGLSGLLPHAFSNWLMSYPQCVAGIVHLVSDGYS